MASFDHIQFLIISRDVAYREILRFVIEHYVNARLDILESEQGALQYFRNINEFPHAIIYEYVSDAYLVEDLISFLREERKDVPIIVVTKAEKDVRDESSRDFFENFPNFHLISKESSLEKVIEVVEEVFFDLFPRYPLANEQEFVRLSLAAMRHFRGIHHNLFIKLHGRMVKLLHAQEEAHQIDLEKYRLRGLEFFYLKRKEAHEIILQIERQYRHFTKTNSFVFNIISPHSSREDLLEQKILRVNDELHLGEEFKEQIQAVMDRTLEIIKKGKKFDLLLEKIFKSEREKSFFSQKAKLISFLSCSLAQDMGWNSVGTFQKLVYAAFLHDITIAFRPQLMRIGSLDEFELKKSDLSTEDQRLFLSHPRDAASLLKNSFENIPHETESLILQHHELPDGRGFPLKVSVSQISPLSALFIISHDFAYYALLEKDPSLAEYEAISAPKFNFAIFRKIIEKLSQKKGIKY